jgi:hypothetical protein
VQIELTGPESKGLPRSLLDASGSLLAGFRDRLLQLKVTLSYDRTVTKDDGTREHQQGQNKKVVQVPFHKSGRMPFTIDIDEQFTSMDITVSGFVGVIIVKLSFNVIYLKQYLIGKSMFSQFEDAGES